MSLGENIRTLRAERSLSQNDLAEALDVSRQSVSKWETDGAVPDLDKLVKMSELFGVTLDELVKGERPEASAPAAMPSPDRAPHRRLGLVLLGAFALLVVLFAAAGGGLMGAFLGLPLLACGVICLTTRRRTGLWCAWALFLMADLYLRYGTGLSWQAIFLTATWGPGMNYTRLAVAWAQFLVMLLLLGATLRSFWGKALPWEKRCLGRTLGLLAVWVGLTAVQSGALRYLHSINSGKINETLEHWYFWVCHIGDEVRLALFAMLLVTAAALFRGRRTKE